MSFQHDAPVFLSGREHRNDPCSDSIQIQQDQDRSMMTGDGCSKLPVRQIFLS